MVGGLEYFYGGGVNQARPGSTPFGQPLQVIDLGYGMHTAYGLRSFSAVDTYSVTYCVIGYQQSWLHYRVTQIPKDVRDEYLRDMRKIYTPQAYSLFENNCNHFTNDFSNFLTGSGIPVSSYTFWKMHTPHVLCCMVDTL